MLALFGSSQPRQTSEAVCVRLMFHIYLYIDLFSQSSVKLLGQNKLHRKTTNQLISVLPTQHEAGEYISTTNDCDYFILANVAPSQNITAGVINGLRHLFGHLLILPSCKFNQTQLPDKQVLYRWTELTQRSPRLLSKRKVIGSLIEAKKNKKRS